METIKKAKIDNGLENGHKRALELFKEQFNFDYTKPLYIIVPNGWTGRESFFIAKENILTYSSGAKSIQYKVEAKYSESKDSLSTDWNCIIHNKGELHTIIRVN